MRALVRCMCRAARSVFCSGPATWHGLTVERSGECLWQARHDSVHEDCLHVAHTLSRLVDAVWRRLSGGDRSTQSTAIARVREGASACWVQGFQSDNPRTDVRAGRFALDQLYYLACKYPERLQHLRKQAKSWDVRSAWPQSQQTRHQGESVRCQGLWLSGFGLSLLSVRFLCRRSSSGVFRLCVGLLSAPVFARFILHAHRGA